MARCASTKRHWDSRTDAEHVLRLIQQSSERLYNPTAVIRCHCGRWCLTSKEQKTWKRGKRARR